jgi:hypothetical protein
MNEYLYARIEKLEAENIKQFDRRCELSREVGGKAAEVRIWKERAETHKADADEKDARIDVLESAIREACDKMLDEDADEAVHELLMDALYPKGWDRRGE